MIRKILILCFCVSLGFGAFSEEDSMFEALDLQESGKLREARDLYLVLYEETKKIQYLKESIMLSSAFENPNIVLSYIKDYQNATDNASNLDISKVLLDTYIKLNDAPNALKVAKEIQEQEDSPQIHNVLGVIYITMGEKKKAIEEFSWVYENLGTQEALARLLWLLEEDNQYQRALELLDSFLAKNPCEPQFCQQALGFYIKGMQTEKIESLLKKRYDDEPNIANAQSLIAIYAFRKKYSQALEIANRYPFDPKFLIELYVGAKDYKMATSSALQAYKNTNNALYLCYSYLYEFESLENVDKNAVKKLANKMQDAIELLKKDSIPDSLQAQDFAIFYNFIGYTLIDYEIDINKGIEFVNLALEIDPDSVAYLDSLAWGYYKQKQCGKAKEIFAKIPKDEIQEDDELIRHSSALDLCN
ncbi:ATP-dependent nuclease [Helicobacter himalayensis]|uniref:ATP-dependent nuclease n=1 Tax=Helicobacter himalayensis TaxID=1591088 RepID=UPI003D6FCFDC